MITLPSGRVYFGDFHGQWNEDYTNPALLVAAHSYYGYDFSVFQGFGPSTHVDGLARDLHLPLKFFPGRECMFDWAHVTTWGLQGEPPPLDEADFRAVLADLKRRCHMLMIAHPFEPFIPHLEGLLDEGLVDAVEIVNGGPAKVDRQAPILRWLADMQAKGKRVPVVGGMDIHVAEGFQRPDVCYCEAFVPQTDFGAIDRNRTAVLADELTPEAILGAVRQGRSVVEAGGELLGDAELVAQLEREGYWQARRQAQARLDEITLVVEGGELLGGHEGVLRPQIAQPSPSSAWRPSLAAASGGGGQGWPPPTTGEMQSERATVRIFKRPEQAQAHEWQGGRELRVTVPHAFDRNLFYLGASVESPEGLVKGFALKVRSPVEIELVSEPQGPKGCRAVLSVINRSREVVQGRATLTPAGEPARELTLGPLAPEANAKLPCEISAGGDPSQPVEVSAGVRIGGLTRATRRKLVFVGVPHMENDGEAAWRDVPKIFMGREDQIDPFWTHQWRGPEDSSATVQWAWNRQALMMRAVVTDDVLCPSVRAPKQPMFGDSLQIAINPIDREDLPAFGVYDFFLTRHLQGDCLLLDRSPHIACEGIRRASDMAVMPASMFSTRALPPIDCAGGKLTQTLLTARLPWHVLIPMQPLPGYRFNLFLILWDNDGQGCKASLQWPRYTEADTQTVWYAVNNNCWAQMTLTP
jgi:hypothetical protein